MKVEKLHLKRHPRKSQGYTLLEILVVLSIVLMLSSYSTFHFKTLYEQQIISDFLTQLQQDIWLAQEYAMSHSHYVEITFSNTHSFYELHEKGYRNLIIKRPYSSRLKVIPLTITTPIVFRSNGNINRPGSMYVTYMNETYKVTFQLGKGRFYIEKLQG
jgi:competence protein ComGD